MQLSFTAVAIDLILSESMRRLSMPSSSITSAPSLSSSFENSIFYLNDRQKLSENCFIVASLILICFMIFLPLKLNEKSPMPTNRSRDEKIRGTTLIISSGEITFQPQIRPHPVTEASVSDYSHIALTGPTREGECQNRPYRLAPNADSLQRLKMAYFPSLSLKTWLCSLIY